MAARGILGPGNVPTILGAKPSHAEPQQRGPILKIMKDESTLKGRAGPIGSLKVIDDKWEHTGEKVNQFLSESNVDYQVIGVLGCPAVGKSTILNALYGLAADHPSIVAGRTPPPFPVQSDETRMLARHCSGGVEMRVTAERLILLDSQPCFSPSVLTDITRPDGSSSVALFPGQSFTAEQALEAMALQQAVFLFSVCHVILVVSEGLGDTRMWELLQAAQLLRDRTFRPPSASAPTPPPTPPPRQSESVPSPPLRTPEDERPGSSSNLPRSGPPSERLQQGRPLSQPGPKSLSVESRPGSAARSAEEQRRPGSASTARPPDASGTNLRNGSQRPGLHSPEVVFVATKLKGSELLWGRLETARKDLIDVFPTWVNPQPGVSYIPRAVGHRALEERSHDSIDRHGDMEQGDQRGGRDDNQKGSAAAVVSISSGVSFFPLPAKGLNSAAFESFPLSLRMLRDQVMGIPRKHLLGKPMTEATWLRYTSRIWKDIRDSEAIRNYLTMLQADGFFR